MDYAVWSRGYFDPTGGQTPDQTWGRGASIRGAVQVRKWWIAAILVAVAIGAAALLGRGTLYGREDSAVLTLYGNIDVREIDLAFRVPGRIDALRVDEGDKVTAGQVVAELDKRPFRDALATAAARVDIADATVAKAQSGNRVQEIGQAEARLREAQTQVEVARKSFDRRSTLAASGAISRRDLEATDAQYQAAHAQADFARESLSLLRAGARAEDRQAATAQAAAARAERNGARTSVEDATLTTPLAGTVTTRAKEIGAIVRPGETVLTIAIDNPVRVRAYVAGKDLSRIAPGMKVGITADGNRHAYRGRIVQIAANAEFTPRTVQTEDLRTDLVYRVRIVVDRSDGALRQGQPVTITVPVAPSRDAD